jgi:glycerate kinase
VRVLVCPDKFAGTLTAVQAAEAIAAGWRDAAPADEVVTVPLADGGPGFLDVLHTARGGRLLPVPTVDPLGRPVTGSVLIDGDTGYVESAQACGLHLVKPEERTPLSATSYGLGPLVSALVESGVRTAVVGLGGSATTDAGAGFLAALGAPPLDSAGYVLPYGGAALLHCVRLGGVPRLREVTLVAATDVDNPLVGEHGAAHVFGPQKGATATDVALLDGALARFAPVLEKDLRSCPPRLAELPGAGAAGGLGAAILALGGRRESGVDLVARMVDLAGRMDRADIVITGEGSFDQQSLRGKVVSGVAAAARERGLPCLVLAGRVDPAVSLAGVTSCYSLVAVAGEQAALARPAEELRALAAYAARALPS